VPLPGIAQAIAFITLYILLFDYQFPLMFQGMYSFRFNWLQVLTGVSIFCTSATVLLASTPGFDHTTVRGRITLNLAVLASVTALAIWLAMGGMFIMLFLGTVYSLGILLFWFNKPETSGGNREENASADKDQATT
jgi:predicted membrane channel-forming protein YqfA (hemolysin III family)